MITITDFFLRPGILREDLDAGNEHIALPNIYNSPAWSVMMRGLGSLDFAGISQHAQNYEP